MRPTDFIPLLVTGLLAAAPFAARASSPAARLAGTWPALFGTASLSDTEAGGELGARLVSLTPGLRQMGLEPEDVILAADGRRLTDETAFARGTPVPSIWTVWRQVPGSRPILRADILGVQVVDEFSRLEAAARTPMRLAVMLANQRTLVESGAGVLLVPTPEDFDAAWLAVANPLPRQSEEALREVVDALESRVVIPAPVGTELEAATADFERQRYLESRERARRALVRAVLEPEARTQRHALDAALRLYVDSARFEARRRDQLLAPESDFVLVLEGQLNRIQAFLPQNTLLDVENSTGFNFDIGARLRLLWFSDGRSQFERFFLQVQYGQIRNAFDDGVGAPVLDTVLQKWSFELVYRPALVTRLKPYFRGGVGIFPLTARERCSGSEFETRATDWGTILGGGIDFLKLQSPNLRASLTGTYRILKYDFATGSEPNWAACEQRNQQTNPDLRLDDGYRLDMDGWQFGLALELGL